MISHTRVVALFYFVFFLFNETIGQFYWGGERSASLDSSALWADFSSSSCCRNCAHLSSRCCFSASVSSFLLVRHEFLGKITRKPHHFSPPTRERQNYISQKIILISRSNRLMTVTFRVIDDRRTNRLNHQESF